MPKESEGGSVEHEVVFGQPLFFMYLYILFIGYNRCV